MNASPSYGIRPLPLLLSVMALACSAGDLGDPAPASGGGSQVIAASGGGSPLGEEPPLPAASGGQLAAGLGGSGGSPPPAHPLFGAGNNASVDLDDPCLTATRWKEETAIDLEQGSVVLFEGTLWELTGTSNENWALPDCTPPGTGWCQEQYAWQAVGACPDGGA